MPLLDSKESLNLITEEDVISLLADLGSDYITDENGDLKFTTICHGGSSRKLYYYKESKHFHCYTGCGQLSIYDLLMQIYGWDFNQAFRFLVNFKGLSDYNSKKEKGFNKNKQVCSDWKFLNKYKTMRKEIPVISLPVYNKADLNRFDNIYPESWLYDHIDEKAMWRFGIKFYTLQWKVVIPHYNINGDLIGIRGRSFLKQDVDNGKKYMPIYYGNQNYKHPLQFNLYGLHENLEAIKRKKKLILFESEKAVLQCESYYPDNNFAVALCGSSMSNYIWSLIMSLEIDELFIAIDKQYKTELETDKDKKEYEEYLRKVKKIADRFVHYMNVYIVYCDDERISYKDSPSDKGKEMLEELMKEKHKYTIEEDDKRRER